MDEPADHLLLTALREDPGFARRYADAIDQHPELEHAREALHAAFPEHLRNTDKER
jgi:hypothetical protein